MSDQGSNKGPRILSRRDFLLATATVAGTGIVMANTTTSTETSAQTTSGPAVITGGENAETVNVGVIGVGAQGRVLIESMIKIPGIKIIAIADIWSYSQQYASRALKAYGHTVNVYEDFNEMLDKEKDLHAVVVASPDFVHAPHTIAALEKGLHVYCEKEMANTLEAARSIVEAQRRTGKIVQIGHQRRSNPRYLHAVNNLIGDAKLLGRVNHAYGQWNRGKSDDLAPIKRYPLDAKTLEKYGYANEHEFRNWRWFKKYGGGPIVDLGSHQIDIFSWVFKSNPISVLAVGGVDYYTNHEWYDNVYALYEFQTEGGIARAFYKVLTTTKHGLFYETFMGDQASLDISEDSGRGNWAWREEHAPDWSEWIKKGWVIEPVAAPAPNPDPKVVVDVRASTQAAKWQFPNDFAKPAHQPHLENFFNAIRNGEKLNCPVEVGYETAVAVLKVNEAVAAGKKILLTPEDYIVKS